MIKKILFTFLFTFFILYPALPQNNYIKEYNSISSLLKNSKVTKSISKVLNVLPVVNSTIGDTVAFSTYDFWATTILRKQLAYYNGINIGVTLRGNLPSSPDQRNIVYIYQDGGNYVTKSVFDNSIYETRSAAIDVARTGSAIGTVGIVGHTPDLLGIYDGTNFFYSQFDPYYDPSLLFLHDNIYLASSGNRIQYTFYKTANYGIKYFNYDSISAYSPTPILWNGNAGVEPGMTKSLDENIIAYFGNNYGAGTGNLYEGYPKDQCNNLWAVYSSNSGTSWIGGTIAVDGDTNLIPSYTKTVFVDVIEYKRGDSTYTVNYNKDVDLIYAPLFSWFAQVDACIANDGTAHVLANGYGVFVKNLMVTRPGTSTIDTVTILGPNAYPMIYWNSRTNTWKKISNPIVENIPADTISKRMGLNYCGGQAYPSISISSDGQVLFALWTGPQANGANVDTGSNGIYYTDLYYATSLNGGDTWSIVRILAGKKDVAETFGNADHFLQDNAGNYDAHILYLEDLVPGQSFIDGTAISNNPIVYKVFTISPTGIKNGNLIVNKFDLSQNYPNPFNPTTTIKFSIPIKNLVTLKVYDILGREVATLVNDVKNAGTYEVRFNASKLASGLYLYTLKSSDKIVTKKMLLIK